MLEELNAHFKEGGFRLLIVDSIMNCFRVDYHGRGELAERQQKLNQFLHRAAHMCEGQFRYRISLKVSFADLCRIQPLRNDGNATHSRGSVRYSADNTDRQIKCNQTPAPVLSSLAASTGVKLLVGTFSPMPPLQEYWSGKEEERKGWPRLSTLQVRLFYFHSGNTLSIVVLTCLHPDVAESEASYVITTGGIDDAAKL